MFSSNLFVVLHCFLLFEYLPGSAEPGTSSTRPPTITTAIATHESMTQEQAATESEHIVSAARSLTCRDDLDSKWRLLLTLRVVQNACLSLNTRFWQCLILIQQASALPRICTRVSVLVW